MFGRKMNLGYWEKRPLPHRIGAQMSPSARMSPKQLNLRPRRAPPFTPERVFLVGGYDAASEKDALSRLPALLRWPPWQHCLVDYHGRAFALADEILIYLGPR
jgi:hypothetical protein